MSTPLAPLSAEERACLRASIVNADARLCRFPTGHDATRCECRCEGCAFAGWVRRLLAERDSLERERDEARAQIFAAHAERNEADRDLAVAQEQVRSLTVERDHLAMVVEQRKAAGASYREALEKIGTDANDLRGRLSRAREGLVRAESAVDNSDYGHWRSEGLEALAKVRAALAEPLGGDS